MTAICTSSYFFINTTAKKITLHISLGWGGGGVEIRFPTASPSAAYTHPVAKTNNPTYHDYHYNTVEIIVLHIYFRVIFLLLSDV